MILRQVGEEAGPQYFGRRSSLGSIANIGEFAILDELIRKIAGVLAYAARFSWAVLARRQRVNGFVEADADKRLVAAPLP